MCNGVGGVSNLCKNCNVRSFLDGINEVRASARLFVRLITDDMLLNSITVRLAHLTASDFLSPLLYDRFVSAIATIVPVTIEKVFVVSVRNDTDVTEKVNKHVMIALSTSIYFSRSFSAGAQRKFVRATSQRQRQ